MTTLALPLTPTTRLNWQRVGALSGSLALHVGILVLLLIPATAIKLAPPTDQTITVDWFEPKPKPVEIPPDPVPVKKEQPKPRLLTPAPTPPPVQAPPVASEAPINEVVVDRGPPARDIGPAQAADTAPAALAYLTRTPVAYPHDAAQRHEQGTVILRVLVGEDGKPQTVEIERSSGFRALDTAARSAVLRWTFTPGTHNGVVTALWARVPIAFTLQTF